MSRWLKIPTGLGLALLVAWLYHGPLGGGERFIAAIEARAKAMVAASELPGIDVQMERDPISRTAVLSGPANDFQREGLGSFPGLNDRVLAVSGVRAVRWDHRTCCAEGR